MLIPLTRAKFEQLVPLTATGEQYRYYWGKPSDLLRRLLISFVAVVGVVLVEKLLGIDPGGVTLIFAIIALLYWFWVPVYWATLRNAACRRYAYSGFWRGRVLEVYVTEELIDTEETVNNQGELVIVENRERRINVEVGDQSGFRTLIQAPLKRIHKAIAPGQMIECLVFSNDPDLSEIAQVSDAYIPSRNLWIGDYPYVRREDFIEVSRRLREVRKGDRAPQPKPRHRYQ